MPAPTNGNESPISLETLLAASLDDLMAIAESRFGVHFEPVAAGEHRFELLQMNDLAAYVEQLAEQVEDDESIHLPFWARVWPANVILSLHLDRLTPKGDSRLLEIGSGAGLASMVAAQRGFSVTLADADDNSLLFARINALKNDLAEQVDIRRIDFTTDTLGERYDVIAGCEVLYRDDAYRPLAKFLLRSLVPAPQSQVLLARSYTRKATRFYNIADADFKIDERVVGCKSCDTGDASPAATDEPQADPERHLIAVSRLTPRKGARRTPGRASAKNAGRNRKTRKR